MRVSRSEAVRSNAGVAGSIGGSFERGIGNAPVHEIGFRREVGHTSRTRSHSVITTSTCFATNSSRCLVRFALMSIPRCFITRTALGWSGFGLLPALAASTVPAGEMLQERLGDL